jgi:uncharacterized protein (TIGR00297 family)
MTSSATDIPWRKAIPKTRDRLQSRILVGIVMPVPIFTLVGYSAVLFVPYNDMQIQPPFDARPLVREMLLISSIFALLAWILRAATPAAAICGGTICFSILSGTGFTAAGPLHSDLVALVTLFLLTFAATRTGRVRKGRLGLSEGRRGRSASQVAANLGIASWLAFPFGQIALRFPYTSRHVASDLYLLTGVRLMVLAALTEATADTVSSEIGQAFGGTPILLTTLRRVAPGTDGAITLLGTIAGIAAAALIAITGIPAMGMSVAECAVAFAAGVAGLFFDSLLGATVESRGWIGNDLVNFFSTAFAAAVSLAAIRFAQPLLLR